MPSKVSAFSWKVIRERIPSKEILLKHGVHDGIDSGTCSSCFSAVESSNHLLFTCSSVILVWSKILHWLGKSVLYSSCASDHFMKFVGLEQGVLRRTTLGLVWQSTIWKIWED